MSTIRGQAHTLQSEGCSLFDRNYLLTFRPEPTVAEQRYQTVRAGISDGLSVMQAAEKAGVSRHTVHAWLARYEAEGLDGLVDRSHRPVSCPHQMSLRGHRQP